VREKPTVNKTPASNTPMAGFDPVDGSPLAGTSATFGRVVDTVTASTFGAAGAVVVVFTSSLDNPVGVMVVVGFGTAVVEAATVVVGLIAAAPV
jgi:hypothetical protein